MTLAELIAALEAADPNLVLPCGFTNPHSYRGYYHQLAFEPARNVTVAAMLTDARSAIGATYEGWKGGDYTMTPDTTCNISPEGVYGGDDDEITPESLAAMLAAGAVPEPVAERPVADHRPYIETVADFLKAAGLPVHDWTVNYDIHRTAHIELVHDDDRVVVWWHEAHGWEYSDSAYDDDTPESLGFAGTVDPPAIVLASLISESWTARNMLRAEMPDDEESALAAYTPTGPRPGQEVTTEGGRSWTYVDIGGELRLIPPVRLRYFAWTQEEVVDEYGPITPVRDAADVMPAGEAAELEAATTGHDPADYVEAPRPEPDPADPGQIAAQLIRRAAVNLAPSYARSAVFAAPGGTDLAEEEIDERADEVTRLLDIAEIDVTFPAGEASP